MSDERVSLLLIEHRSGVARVLEDALSEAVGSYDVQRVSRLEDGLAALADRPFDMVLLDMAVPDHPGLGGFVLLRSACDIAIVVLTVAAREAVALKAVMQGADEYLLLEQLFPTLIVRAVRHALERHRVSMRERLATRALRESEERYRSLFERSREAIYIAHRDGRVLDLNASAAELLGETTSNVASWFVEREALERFTAGLEASGAVTDFEARLRRPDGNAFWALISAAARRSPQGEVEGHHGIIHDITGRKEVERELLHHAFHDTLTGLPNRALFLDRLEHALARASRRPDYLFAVLFLDLDRFKIVNDSLGHLLGDALLRQVAAAVSSCVRAEDTVARLGGDEFALLLDGMEGPDDPERVATRILHRLGRAFELEGRAVFTSASIGIALGSRLYTAPGDLLRDADIAMYRAKAGGRAGFATFDQEMHAQAVDVLRLETDLRMAAAERQLALAFQPILALQPRRLIGFEALLRWQHPERGMLLPDAFLAIAEETGLIGPIGLWVLEETCRRLAEWNATIPAPGLVASVNLSPRQLRDASLPEHLAAILERTGAHADHLLVEITEGALMHRGGAGITVLRSLRDLGVRICIDDFGTGYSSLAYLQQFPVDFLKIDRSFTARIGGTDGARELVRTILALARNLGLDTVAEGVETAEQLAQLQLLGARYAQGFLFATPMQPEAIPAYLALHQTAGVPARAGRRLPSHQRPTPGA